MFAPPVTLGGEIQRLRLKAGFTLRKFAGTISISAAHQSDIEHDRRRPSPALLHRVVAQLSHVGATLEHLTHLDSRLEPDVREWIAGTPAARQMLRAVRDSGRDPTVVLRQLEDILRKADPK